VTGACLWCGETFKQRTDGGKAQRFCRPACRRAFETASRRFVAEAIAGGALTVDALRNGAPATRALLPGTISPSPVAKHPRRSLLRTRPRTRPPSEKPAAKSSPRFAPQKIRLKILRKILEKPPMQTPCEVAAILEADAPRAPGRRLLAAGFG
jgi:hypothetical protein